MKIKKIIGYFLLFVGLALLCWTLVKSYNIFSGKIPPPSVFSLKTEVKKETAGSIKNLTLQVQDQVEQMVLRYFNQVLPGEAIEKMLNLSAWTMLAFVFIAGASVLCNISIRIILF